MANRKGECGSRHRFSLLGSEITTDGDCSREMRRRLFLRRKVTTTLDSVLETRRHFADKHPCSQGYGFSSGHVWMWELDCEESWAPKNWCFWTMVLEKTLESPLDCKEIQPGHPKGNQSWIFIGRMDAEAETPILWLPDAGKDWMEAEKGDDRGWDGWIASQTQWTWVWVNSRSWWWIGRSCMLQFMGLQRVGHNWATELNWTDEDMQSYILA